MLVWILGIIDGQKRYDNGSIEIDSETRELMQDKLYDIIHSGENK